MKSPFQRDIKNFTSKFSGYRFNRRNCEVSCVCDEELGLSRSGTRKPGGGPAEEETTGEMAPIYRGLVVTVW